LSSEPPGHTFVNGRGRGAATQGGQEEAGEEGGNVSVELIPADGPRPWTVSVLATDRRSSFGLDADALQ
jgi:hypothetical protein